MLDKKVKEWRKRDTEQKRETIQTYHRENHRKRKKEKRKKERTSNDIIAGNGRERFNIEF